MYKVIVVNGKPKCGKTTFENFCKEQETDEIKIHIVSSIDYVKECAKKIGWNGEKDCWGRNFLSDLKKVLSDYNDSPFLEVEKKIKAEAANDKKHIFFVDSREPYEIMRYAEDLGAVTILVRSPKTEEEITTNTSDYYVNDYSYDYIIENNGDLEQLKTSAEAMMERFEKDDFYGAIKDK